VIILTSNIGSQYILDTESSEQRETLVMESLRSHFRPEFLNRVDDIIIFDRLEPEDLTAIVEIQLRLVVKRLEKKGIVLQIDEEAKRRLAHEGYDPVYGARPLKRVIQKRVLNPLSMELLEGRFSEGQTVEVFADGESIGFRARGE
jgi:ATP-dependent Clp protease ATP-binding subunit ClpB